MRTVSVVLVFLVLAATASVKAQFSYTTNADGVTLTITGYFGSPSLGAVNIPASINGLTVVNIGDSAFAGVLSQPQGEDSYPTIVTIPGSVTNIGENAFLYCTSLTNVIMADGVITIGAGAFNDCPQLRSVTIAESVTLIGSNAFNLCDSLGNITIPSSVTNIASYTFADGHLNTAFF